jgi:hypothetical protein
MKKDWFIKNAQKFRKIAPHIFNILDNRIFSIRFCLELTQKWFQFQIKTESFQRYFIFTKSYNQ